MTPTTANRQGRNPGGSNQTGAAANMAYSSSITESPAYVKTDLLAMIRQAARLAELHDTQAAQAAHSLAQHTAAAAKHRAILRSLRELADKRRSNHGAQ